MEIALRKMTPEEFVAYTAISIPEYAAEKKKGENLTDEQATKVATESYKQLLPNGLDSEDQFLFSVIESASSHEVPSSGNVIGTVWLGRKHTPRPHVWIYDIVLNESARGKGYGAQAMKLLEDEVRNLGVNSIGLHVFGHNTVAQSLYEKSGFRTTNRIMVKDL